MITLKKTIIPSCFHIAPLVVKDKRGVFVKVFQQEYFSRQGLETSFPEEYYTISKKRVLRGLHFQIPPCDQTKIVHCLSGKVIDVVVDLRIGSPAYGKYATFTLDAKKGDMIYIPKGLAHGFYVLSQQAIMLYKVSTAYSPEHDKGILWNSAGIPWADSHPIISSRDRKFVPFSEFKSPFIYKK